MGDVINWRNEAMHAASAVHSKQRTDAVINKLREAMNTIDKEIEDNNGLYPLNTGKITQLEVCRRADVSHMTLYSPSHKDSTRLEVLKWLKNKKNKTKRDVDHVVADMATYWKAQHHKVATQICIYELELVEKDVRIRQLEVELAKLKDQFAILGESKITVLKPGKKKEH